MLLCYFIFLFLMIMIAGEIDYSEIFFKDKPPLGWAEKWDQDWESVPFPFITYGMFLVFFFFVSIVALNVLVGLTVDDIRNFLENADLRKLTMRLKFILAMERLAMKNKKNKTLTSDRIEKENNLLEASATSDLISIARIWEKMEKKQEDSRKKGETEEERRNLKDMINDQTQKLRTEINHQTTKLKSEMNRRGRPASFARGSSQQNEYRRTMSGKHEDNEFRELFDNMKSLMAHMKKQNAEIENIKKMLMKGRSDVE